LRCGHFRIFMLVVEAPMLEGRNDLFHPRYTKRPRRIGTIITLPFLIRNKSK
jgi:hypothetical protein